MKRLMRPVTHCATLADTINLRDLMEAKFESMEKAVAVAKDSLDVRLESMNEFRKQISEQAANFMPRSEYILQHQTVIERVDNLQKICDERFDRMDQRIKDVEMLKANVQGRIWATAVVVTLAIAGVQVVIHVFLGK